MKWFLLVSSGVRSQQDTKWAGGLVRGELFATASTGRAGLVGIIEYPEVEGNPKDH